MFAFVSFLSYTATAILLYTTSAFETIDEIVLYVSKSLWNHFFTFIISTPHLLKYAAASNVLTPVLKVKFFVSIIIPAYNASTSVVDNLISFFEYTISSVTSSAAEDAYTSWRDNIGFSIYSVLILWWSITTILLVFSNNSGTSTYVLLFVSTTITKEFEFTFSKATSLPINTSSYSLCSLILAINLSRLIPVVSLTINASFCSDFAILYIPSADPIQSISLLLWPIIKILSESIIISSRASATVLALTLVLFSSSSVLPPKNTYFPFSLTTAWSPPRPNAMSIPALAFLYFW